MLEETSEQLLEEIVKFVNEVVQTRQELLKDKFTDCNVILKRFGYQNTMEDSGFESESITESSVKFIIPSATLLPKFEASDFDIIFEHSLKHLCMFIENAHVVNQSTQIEICIDTVEKCVCYLDETDSSVPFREFVQMRLESMLEQVMTNGDDTEKFNFIMELFRRFGLTKCLQDNVIEILLKYLDLFASNLKRQKADATFTFCFETDFRRANIMMLVIYSIKQQNADVMTTQDNDIICRTLENLVDMDDFFALGFLSYKCYLN
ncbi:hypothetical protein CBL_11297 [Carabus blaptoides fortunei]